MSTHIDNPFGSGWATHYQNIACPWQITWQRLDSTINMDIAPLAEKNVEIIHWFPIKHADFANVGEEIQNTVDKCKSPVTIILCDDVGKPRARLITWGLYPAPQIPAGIRWNDRIPAELYLAEGPAKLQLIPAE